MIVWGFSGEKDKKKENETKEKLVGLEKYNKPRI